MQQRNTSLQFLIRLIYKSTRYATLQNSRKHNTLTNLYRGCGKSAAVINSIIYRAFEHFSLPSSRWRFYALLTSIKLNKLCHAAANTYI